MNDFESHHSSDCAVHNMPAYPNSECDCGLYNIRNELQGMIPLDDVEPLAVKLLLQEISRHNKRGRPKYVVQQPQETPCEHFYRGTDGVHVCIVERCNHPDKDKWAQRT